MKMKECKKFVNYCKTYFNIQHVKIKLVVDESIQPEDAYVVPIKRGKYKIAVGSLDVMDTFLKMAIAHEMTHVKQWELDGLALYYKGSKSKFKGVVYDIDLDNDSEYFSAPWEVEARINEVPIAYYYAKNNA